MCTEYVQDDPCHSTGTVDVFVDTAGQPEYKIAEAVAWDDLEWTQQWAGLAAQADAVCFGSLAQRSPTARATIRQFLNAASPKALTIYDVNLRHTFFSRAVLHESLELAHVVKLNDQELPRIAELLSLGGSGERDQAQRLLDRYGLRLVCVTRGEHGSLLVADGQIVAHKGFRIRVADTVGAGDAFTACLTHDYIRGAPLEEINDRSNRVAAWMASQVGATPSARGRDLNEILAGIGTS